MPEETKEIKPNDSGVTEENFASVLGDAIKQKDAEIEKMKKAHLVQVKELTQQIVDGRYAEEDEDVEIEKLPTRLECYKKYKENKFATNLDFWKNFLQLREATKREYGKDPLVTGSYGFNVEGEPVDAQPGEAEAMDYLCEQVQSIIDEVGNDPSQFNLRLNALVK